ncbi:MAG: hypothetical protein IBX71_09170 [Candidatus Desulforudis sp.]|nr:hypothetical protein [Desulforudis sp.]
MDREFSPEERRFMRRLDRAGLPEELGNWLEEHGPAPSAEALGRIRRRTLSRLESGRRRSFWRSFGTRVAAAVLLLAVASTLIAGPQRVLAGIESLLRYVPGFGAMEVEEQPILAAQRPVIVESGDKRLEVLGIFSDGRHTEVHIRSLGVLVVDAARMKPLLADERVTDAADVKPFLVDEHGNTYVSQSSFTFGSGPERPVEGWFRFPPLAGDGPQSVELVVPGHEELTARITLVGQESLARLDEVGYTVAAEGITLTVVPELRDHGLAANLVFRMDPDSRISGVGNYPWRNTLPILADDQGRQYGKQAHRTALRTGGP